MAALSTTLALSLSLALLSGAHAQVTLVDKTAQAGLTMTFSPNALMIPAVQEWTLGSVTVGDFNNDGWPDLFVLRSGGAPDRLYLNNGDGTFTDRALQWGVAVTHGGAASCAGDYDNDGWTDLYVTSFGATTNDQGQVGKNRLYHNNGNGTFSEMAAVAGVNFTSTVIPSGNGCAFGDYDLDGHMDLIVAAWTGLAQGNRLYHNNGDGTFTNVTGTAIVFPNPTYGFQPSFVDMDGDGYPEILLSADFHTSRIYHNNRNGTFTDVTDAWGANVESDGMGQCVADFDGDGRIDWYVTSIFKDVPNPGQFDGDTLYLNVSDGHLFQNAGPAGVLDGGWGWGAAAVDFDADGWPDIVEVNGRNSTEWANEPEYLWHNNGDGTFTEIGQQAGLTTAADGRCVVSLDYDRDGKMDIVMVFNNGPLKLYHNETPGGHWLKVYCNTQGNPRVPPRGRGVRATAVVGGRTLVRYLDGGHGYGGSSEEVLYFGLAQETMIDTLTLEWPPGYTTVLHNVAADQEITVTPPLPADLNSDGVVNGADLGILLSSWGTVVPGSPGHLCDLNNSGKVDGADLAILLGTWGN